MIEKVNYLPSLGKSDFLVLMFQFNCIENNSNISKKYNFNKGDYSARRDLLSAVDWNIRMDGLGISESWTGFMSILVLQSS